MWIKFKQDYRGVLTGEIFYEAGTVINHENGAELVKQKRATKTSAPKKQEEKEKAE